MADHGFAHVADQLAGMPALCQIHVPRSSRGHLAEDWRVTVVGIYEQRVIWILSLRA